MRLLLDKGRNILTRLTSLIKDCIVDVLEGNLTRQEWLALYSCVIIFTIFFIVGAAS
jgi:hypothetical protein